MRRTYRKRMENIGNPWKNHGNMMKIDEILGFPLLRKPSFQANPITFDSDLAFSSPRGASTASTSKSSQPSPPGLDSPDKAGVLAACEETPVFMCFSLLFMLLFHYFHVVFIDFQEFSRIFSSKHVQTGRPGLQKPPSLSSKS